MALNPGAGRFARDVELLFRLRYPSVPRLVDHGLWLRPGGLDHPYLAMEWVEDVSLYDWAQVECPTSRQVLRVLASLARALEATHSAGGVHRDVKGDNVLVRAADGQVFLTDFSSGSYVGAARLTSPPFPPGTQPYRSPEAWRSVRLPYKPSDTAYAPGPADDIFALGMTAYQLVTDDYPPTPALLNEVAHLWGPEGTAPCLPMDPMPAATPSPREGIKGFESRFEPQDLSPNETWHGRERRPAPKPFRGHGVGSHGASGMVERAHGEGKGRANPLTPFPGLSKAACRRGDQLIRFASVVPRSATKKLRIIRLTASDGGTNSAPPNR